MCTLAMTVLMSNCQTHGKRGEHASHNEEKSHYLAHLGVLYHWRPLFCTNRRLLPDRLQNGRNIHECPTRESQSNPTPLVPLLRREGVEQKVG